MKRSRVFTPLLISLILTSALAGGSVAEELEGSFWYVMDHLTTAEDGAEAVVWVTLPPAWQGQEIEITSIVPEPAAVLEDTRTGNRVIEWVYNPDKGNLPVTQLFHYDFKLKQTEIRFEIDPSKVEKFDRDSAEYRAYTKAETWIQTDGKILDSARRIVKGEKNPWLQTTLIFDWCLENLSFVPGGYGDRDALSTLGSRKGDCGQYGRLMVAFCRSLGIPSRTITSEWLSGGSHVFVEVFMPGYGWVPADISLAQMLLPDGAGFSDTEVARFMSERNVPLGDPHWFLGNLCSSRVITTVGNNITIDSPTLGNRKIFKSMRPGGAKAHPKAVRIDGFNGDMIHGGFFVFDHKIESDEEAHQIAHMRLASSFFKVGLYDVVEEGCRKSLDDYSDGVQSWINMGKVYMHKGEYYKAEATFRRAMKGQAAKRKEKLEAVVWTHNYLGNCYDLLNHREMALAEYQIVVDMDNDYRGAVRYARKYLKKPFTKKAPSNR